MSFIDKLFGHQEEPQRPATQAQAPPPQSMSEDEQALARYRYMLQTAPPETIEQAHAEAFAKLTPEQRRLVLQQLSANAPEHERAAASDDPQALARMATRAEVRQPGTMERLFGGAAAPGMAGAGVGLGGMMSGILPSLAAGFVGSMIAQHFFNNTSMGQGFFGGGMGQGFIGGGQERGLHATSDSDDKDDSTDKDDPDNADDSQDDGDDSGSDVDDPGSDTSDSGGDDQFA